MSDELKACPFHQSGCEVAVWLCGVDARQVRADCGTSGPMCETREEAIKFWNTRTPDKEAAWEWYREAAERYGPTHVNWDYAREYFDQIWHEKHGGGK